ncbi:hypothetical protein GCM10022222_02810 [Amycolatopsis ultiminotia]|uniref:Uncharacterized protein n=1 Tax=Amycolatopsis ultiminotia TaxID=543629 RepID=A0ABP6UWI6_9PSEU
MFHHDEAVALLPSDADRASTVRRAWNRTGIPFGRENQRRRVAALSIMDTVGEQDHPVHRRSPAVATGTAPSHPASRNRYRVQRRKPLWTVVPAVSRAGPADRYHAALP